MVSCIVSSVNATEDQLWFIGSELETNTTQQLSLTTKFRQKKNFEPEIFFLLEWNPVKAKS